MAEKRLYRPDELQPTPLREGESLGSWKTIFRYANEIGAVCGESQFYHLGDEEIPEYWRDYDCLLVPDPENELLRFLFWEDRLERWRFYSNRVSPSLISGFLLIPKNQQ